MKHMTPTMQEWLQTRYARREADAMIAHMILMGQVAADGPDYLDLTLVENQPRITYILPEKAEGLSEEERFTKRGARIVGRPGSVVQKVLGTKPDGHAMDRLTQSAGIFLNPPSPAHFALLEGDDVWRIFDQRNMCGCQSYNSILSCMTGRGDQRTHRPGLVLYERHAQIAVYTCGGCGMYAARAIVWTDVVTHNRFYDRIYGSNEANHALGALLAERAILPIRFGDGRDMKYRVTIALSPDEIARHERIGWPALDTMNQLCRTCCTLSNIMCEQAQDARSNYWNYGGSVTHGPVDPLIARLERTDDDATAGGEEAP